jgi:hypothetical protein
VDRSEIVAALTALGAVLDRRGVRGEMYIVGGAAIALAYVGKSRDQSEPIWGGKPIRRSRGDRLSSAPAL